MSTRKFGECGGHVDVAKDTTINQNNNIILFALTSDVRNHHSDRFDVRIASMRSFILAQNTGTKQASDV